MFRNTVTIFLLVSLFVLSVPLLAAAPSSNELTVQDLQVFGEESGFLSPEQQLLDYFSTISNQTFVQRKQRLDSIQTLAEFEHYRADIHEKYLEGLGSFPEKTPLNVKYYGTVDGGDYTFSRITYESLPGCLVAANLYQPKTHRPPYPLVLCTTGHWWGGSEEPDGKGYFHVQERSVQLARLGYIVLAFDPFGQGERKLFYDPDFAVQSSLGRNKHQHIILNLQLHLTGHNMTRLFIWDCIRGIDVLCGLKDADTTRIAVTGSSGGGSQVQFVSGVDPRITAAIPVCANWQQGAKYHPGTGNVDGEQNIPGRIRYGLELSDLFYMSNVKDILLMNATGDVLLLNSSVDMYSEMNDLFARIYPVGERSVSYHLVGSAHSYNREFREILYNWLNQKFGKFNEPAMEKPVTVRDAQEINITGSGSIEELHSETPLSLNRMYADKIAPTLPDIRGITDLRSFQRSLGHQIRTVLKLPPVPAGITSRILKRKSGSDYDLEKIAYQVDHDLWIPAILITPRSFDPGSAKARTVIYIHERGKANGFENILRLVKKDYQVFAVDTRGFRETPDPHPEQSPRENNPAFIGYDIIFSEDYDAEFNAFAYELEQPLFGMRLHDILTGIAYLKSRPDMGGGALDILGVGDGALLALHAVVLDRDIDRITLARMPVSFRELAVEPYGAQSPFLFIHNVLAYYDTPQLIAALAPRPVLVAGMVDAKRRLMNVETVEKAHGFGREVYKQLDAAADLNITGLDEMSAIARL